MPLAEQDGRDAPLAERLQNWVYSKLPERPSVAEAAVALEVPALRIAETVGYHYWMFLTGDLTSPETALIDTEGE